MSLQVLVVEDDRSIREMMRQALSLEGFHRAYGGVTERSRLHGGARHA